jgi:8-hydroxy-5-deazaflavin:NADPH oxidoreductase
MLSNISALPTKIRAWAGTNQSGSSNTLDEDSDKYLGEVPKRAAKVAIIGSGWLGRAVSTRLVEANYDVVIGTRNPHERVNSKFDVQCNYLEVTAACQYGDIIILAIPHGAHSNIVPILALTARDKIVIDCSNRPPNDKYPISVAEELQQSLPDCRLIKAFNDTSAHELSKDCTTGFDKTLCYCGNDNEAKKTVRHLLEHIGANSRDLGALRKARSLEALPFKFFSEWQSAMIVAIPTFIAIVMYTPRWYWDPGNYLAPRMILLSTIREATAT